MWRTTFRGDAGVTQIDTSYQNHQMVASGQIAVGASEWKNAPSGGAFQFCDLTFSGRTAPVLAISCGGTPATYYETNSGGGTYTYRVVKSVGTTGTTDTPVHWWLFDVAPADQAAASGYNMVIRNPDTGVIIFDLARKPLRIIDFLTSIGPGTADYGYAASELAFVPCRLGIAASTIFLGVGGNLDRYEMMTTSAMRNIPGGVRLASALTYFQFYTSSQGSAWPSYTSDTSDWLVVDVTHY